MDNYLSTTFKKLIEEKRVSILFGNGVNNYINTKYNVGTSKTVPSWNKLINDLSVQLGVSFMKYIQGNDSSISYPERFLILTMNGTKKDNLHNMVASLLKAKHSNRYYSTVIKRFKEWDCPIITTNYDIRIESAISLKGMWLGSSQSNIYPVNYYASEHRMTELDDRFSIWHLNGIVSKPQSIKLDLNDYCRYVSWLQSVVPLNVFTCNPKESRLFENSWLSYFFKKDLLIIGLGLLPQEFVIRWLLFLRAKHYKEIGEDPQGYYVSSKEEILSYGQIQFFKTVGIEVVQYSDWNALYGDLFGI